MSRLERVLELRRAEAEACRRELAGAAAARGAAERAVEELAACERGAEDLRRGAAAGGGDVERLRRAHAWLEHVRGRVASARVLLRGRDEVVAAKREAMVLALQRVKSLERLVERRAVAEPGRAS